MPETIPSLPVYGFDPSSLSGLLSLVITVLLPLVVGLVTTRTTSAGAKALLLLFAAAVKSLLEAWLQAANSGVDFALVPVAITVAVNFGIAAAVHFGLWKPAGVSDAAQRAFTSRR
ncbi:hypothetical protein [Actinoplanes sp. NPDC049599]|uniref:hypothetical protein n=1 Tax=Actinoplanes sp. NPDC049599 TaxID=3363903 RepID=UPI0037ABA801